jgi:ribosomal protein L11 methyltransferase
MATWHALAVRLSRPAVQPVGKALLALGATGLMEDVPPGTVVRYKQPWDKGRKPRPPAEVVLRAWFADRPAEGDVRAAVEGRPVDWTEQPEEDWNEGWKVHFQPVRISDRLVVAAPWHDEPGAVVIEPGNAFGTGEHRTTRSCLTAIDRLAVAGEGCLDVGCGSGILALAAARLGMHAWGIDTDPEAVTAARNAATRNALDVRFDTTPLAEVRGEWPLVVANLYAEVIAALAPELRRLATRHLVFAGILSDRAQLVEAAMAGLALESRDEGEGWTSFVYRVD